MESQLGLSVSNILHNLKRVYNLQNIHLNGTDQTVWKRFGVNGSTEWEATIQEQFFFGWTRLQKMYFVLLYIEMKLNPIFENYKEKNRAVKQ